MPILRTLSDNPTIVTAHTRIARPVRAALQSLATLKRLTMHDTYAAALRFASNHPDFPTYCEEYRRELYHTRVAQATSK